LRIRHAGDPLLLDRLALADVAVALVERLDE
jgi:hypothetical protein